MFFSVFLHNLGQFISLNFRFLHVFPDCSGLIVSASANN